MVYYINQYIPNNEILVLILKKVIGTKLKIVMNLNNSK